MITQNPVEVGVIFVLGGANRGADHSWFRFAAETILVLAGFERSRFWDAGEVLNEYLFDELRYLVWKDGAVKASKQVGCCSFSALYLICTDHFFFLSLVCFPTCARARSKCSFSADKQWRSPDC